MKTMMMVLAAVIAAMSLGCGLPDEVPVETGTGAAGVEATLASTVTVSTVTVRTALTLPTLPPTPTIRPWSDWTPAKNLVPLSAKSAFLVMKKDPDYPKVQFLAWGFDPVSKTNLFAHTVALADHRAFVHAWTADVGDWKAYRGSSLSDDGIMDGIGGVPPPPRPSLRDEQAWSHAFYAHQMQEQISAEY